MHLSLVIGEIAYQSLTIGMYVLLNIAMFPILYYENNCNNICHKSFTMSY